VHGGAILAAASDGARIVSGGDDGEVVTTDLGSSRVLGADAKHRWIDHCHEECELQRLGFDRAQLPLRQAPHARRRSTRDRARVVLR
jgi:hypothetical protein